MKCSWVIVFSKKFLFFGDVEPIIEFGNDMRLSRAILLRYLIRRSACDVRPKNVFVEVHLRACYRNEESL